MTVHGFEYLNGKKVDLLQRIAELETVYGLSDLRPVSNLSYNYVLSGVQGSKPVILKLSSDKDGFKQEAAALKAFSGFGAVAVLAEDNGLLLLERAVPGSTLRSFFPARDDEAVLVACQCIRRLHSAPIPDASSFPSIKDWLGALDKHWDIPLQPLQRARELRNQLLQTSAKAVLLHGDLHHDNIVQHGDDWLVIDPKGVIGETAYEVAAFIRNPIPELLAQENASVLISNRITSFAKVLDIPAKRIFDWCFVQAVLAWIWAIEDNYDTDYFKKFVDVLGRVTVHGV